MKAQMASFAKLFSVSAPAFLFSLAEMAFIGFRFLQKIVYAMHLESSFLALLSR